MLDPLFNSKTRLSFSYFVCPSFISRNSTQNQLLMKLVQSSKENGQLLFRDSSVYHVCLSLLGTSDVIYKYFQNKQQDVLSTCNVFVNVNQKA